jgi:hypothetical protein
MLGIILKCESCYKDFYKTFVEKKIKGHQVYGDKEEHGLHVYFQLSSFTKMVIMMQPLCKPIHNPKTLESNWFP